MSKALLVLSSDWADEFTAEKFAIYDTVEAAERQRDYYIQNGGYFGTNEGWEEGELCEADFTITEINDDDADTIVRLLGSSFGTGLV